MKEIYKNLIPIPNRKSIFFSNLLKKKILNKIVSCKKKNISFTKYLNYVLYHKKYGYYNNTLQKFGKKGDFITAPEISKLFGQCLAFHFSKIIGNEYCLLEIGAGSGKLAVSIIEELHKMNIKIKKYYILELSIFLRNQQIKNISDYSKLIFKQVEWIVDFPKRFNGIILANELLDALPFNLVQLGNSHIYEVFVTQYNNTFYLTKEKTKKSKLKNLIKENIPYNIINSKLVYQTEVNMTIEPFFNSLNQCLNNGYMFFIDYGFLKDELYHEERNMGTFMCHYRHFKHNNPFFFPGLQDITYHVDFTHLKKIANKNNLRITGYSNQSDFLISSNLNNIFLRESKNNSAFYNLNKEVFLLTSPNEMGSLFKVIEIKK